MIHAKQSHGIAQRTLQDRPRPLEQPHDGSQESGRTVPRTLLRRRRLPCDALRFACGHGQGPPHRHGHPRLADAPCTHRDRMAPRRGAGLPSQRDAVRRNPRRRSDRQLENLQHRRRCAGQRNHPPGSTAQHLPDDHHCRDQGVVLPRRQDLLGVCQRLRGPRDMGLPRHRVDHHVRHHSARTQQRRRPARRTQGGTQGEHLPGQIEKLHSVDEFAGQDLRLRARHLRGERLGRHRGHGSHLRIERRGAGRAAPPRHLARLPAHPHPPDFSATLPKPTPPSREPRWAARAR